MPVQKTVKLSNQELLSVASEIVKAAEAEGITIRVTGGLAVYIRSAPDERTVSLYARMKRLGAGGPDFGDIDFVGLSRQETAVQQFFIRKGYESDRYVNALFSGSRNMFINREHGFHVDVFYDALCFSHDVIISDRSRNRLCTKSVTLLPTDILLSKLQIHDITRKDLLDLMILQFCHNFSTTDEPDAINLNYVSSLLSDDWGFYFDAISNLAKVKDLSALLLSERVIDSDLHDEVMRKTDMLLSRVSEFPKTKNWEKRSRKGTRKIWYREVDEI